MTPPFPATPVSATPLHAPALAAIHAAAFPPGAQWGPDAIALQLALPGAFALIHPAGAMLLARIAVDEAEILTLATAPAAQRQGHARQLLQAAMHQAASNGATSMVLEVAATNQPAQALYAAAGFNPVGRRPNYYAPGNHALILRAPLTPPSAR